MHEGRAKEIGSAAGLSYPKTMYYSMYTWDAAFVKGFWERRAFWSFPGKAGHTRKKMQPFPPSRKHGPVDEVCLVDSDSAHQLSARERDRLHIATAQRQRKTEDFLGAIYAYLPRDDACTRGS